MEVAAAATAKTVARALKLLETQRKASQAYYARHREEVKARSVSYWGKHKEDINARRRDRYAMKAAEKKEILP